MPATEATHCRLCGTALPLPFLNLGSQPLANNLEGSQAAAEVATTYPLALTKCNVCQSVQLTHTVDPEDLFSNYLYTTGVSKAFQDHFGALATTLDARCRKPKGKHLAVDVGSNDGLLLRCLRDSGWEVVGIEPARNLADMSRALEIPTYTEFMGTEAAARVVANHGRADVVTACNVFAHTGDLQGFLDGVLVMLADDGTFVFEVAYLPRMLHDGTFDLVYHEHVFYHSLTALRTFLGSQGMAVVDVETVDTHGGSLRVYAQRAGDGVEGGQRVQSLLAVERATGISTMAPYQAFAERVKAVKRDLVGALRTRVAGGERVVGYTCPAKAATLINYCGLTSREIGYIVDDGLLKQGKWLPGAAIPVVHRGAFVEAPPKVVVVWAWNVWESILGNLPQGVTAIKPMPEVEIVTT